MQKRWKSDKRFEPRTYFPIDFWNPVDSNYYAKKNRGWDSSDSTSEPCNNEVSISELHDMMLVEIFRFCSRKDIMDSIRFVCERWYEICKDQYIWHESCGEDRWVMELQDAKQVLPYVCRLKKLSIQITENYNIYDERWGTCHVADEDLFAPILNSQLLPLLQDFGANLTVLCVSESTKYFLRVIVNALFFEKLACFCPKLNTLSIEHIIIGPVEERLHVYRGISKMTALKKLEILCSSNISPETLTSIFQNVELEVLCLRKCNVTDTLLQSIATGGDGLKELRIQQQYRDVNTPSVSSASQLGSLPRLVKLHLHLHRVLPKNMSQIIRKITKSKPDLEELVIVERNVERKAVTDAIMNCPRLLRLFSKYGDLNINLKKET